MAVYGTFPEDVVARGNVQKNGYILRIMDMVRKELPNCVRKLKQCFVSGREFCVVG